MNAPCTHLARFLRFARTFPLLADVGREIGQRVEQLLAGNRRPSMSMQCRMSHRNAVIWQAAMIITGKRKITTSSQTKLDKATGSRGYRNRGLTMASAREATAYVTGNWDACRGRTAACTFVCVGSETGQGRLTSSKIARVGRTLAMLFDPMLFVSMLSNEIARMERAASRKGLTLAFRTNVATDHAELAAMLAEAFPFVVFYDYTAITSTARRQDSVLRVYSRKDGRTDLTLAMLDEGIGVCVVFDVTARSKGPLPATWEGYPVIDGDVDDLWFTRTPMDGGPFVVGLRVKATTKGQLAKAIGSGFAVAA